jgi:glucose-1-phosphate thymidylyltransferase
MDVIRYAVVPAAGLGTRIRGLKLERILPKPLYPILGKPIIGWIVDALHKYGVTETYVIVHYKKELIQKYLGNYDEELNMRYHYIYQRDLKGVAHAISLTKKYINEPFFTVLGDTFFISRNIARMTKFLLNKQAIAVEGVVKEQSKKILSQTCSIKFASDNRIIEAIEKPLVPSTKYRGVGVYLFKSEVFDFISDTKPSARGEIEITEVINSIARLNKAYAFLMEGVEVNVNTIDDFIRATKLAIDMYKLRFQS